MKSILLTFLLLFVSSSIVMAQGTLVYQSDFSQGVNGGTVAPGVTLNWSASHLTPNCSNPIQTVTAPLDGRVFLGQFGEQEVTLGLAGLPAHDSISITFDFYAIDTWDGNLYAGYIAAPDVFGLDVDGIDTLLYATFANNYNLNEYQSYPTPFPTNGTAPTNNPPQTGAFSTSQFNFPNPDWWSRIGAENEDAEYHLTYTFVNSNSTVQLNFLGDEVQQTPNLLDESWGIDSIVVKTLGCTPPLAAVVSNRPLMLCAGDSVTLTASPAGFNYEWFKNGQILLVNNETLTVSDSGIYSVIVSNGSGCSDSTAVSVSINPVPVASISGPTSFCVGDKGVLKASPSGLSYHWLKNGLLQPITTDSLIVSDSGRYSVIVSNTSGCTDSTSVGVGLNPVPAAVITGTQSLCPGNSGILTASPSGLSYQWKKNGLSQPTISDSLIISDSGIYSVIVSNGSGCSDSTSTHITINPTLVAGISGPHSMCQGNSATLTASPAGYSYQWMKNGIFQSITSDSLKISDSGVYSVVVSNGECSDSTSISVVINPLPAAIISGPLYLCAGNSAVLKSAQSGLSYEWEKDGQMQPTTADSLVVIDSGTYSLIVSNASGCTDSTAVVVNVTSEPVAEISGTRSFCPGSSTILSASPAGFNYVWLKNSQILPVTADSLLVSDSGIYSVIVSNSGGCFDSNSVSVVLNPVPTVSINGLLSFCTGSSTVLSASPTNLMYEWEKDGVTQSVDADSLAITDSGDYSVIVSNSSGCSDSATVHVIENPLPVVLIDASDTITSTGTMLTATKGVSYLWSNGDTTANISVSKAGSYFVTVIDSNGCTSTSPIFDFVPGCGYAFLEEALDGYPITISGIIPNPATDQFTVSFTNPTTSPIHYEIDDVLGRILTSGETSESQLSLSASDLPEGVLLLRATSNGIVQTREFVVVK
jgi:hypothetical protein